MACCLVCNLSSNGARLVLFNPESFWVALLEVGIFIGFGTGSDNDGNYMQCAMLCLVVSGSSLSSFGMTYFRLRA